MDLPAILMFIDHQNISDGIFGLISTIANVPYIWILLLMGCCYEFSGNTKGG